MITAGPSGRTGVLAAGLALLGAGLALAAPAGPLLQHPVALGPVAVSPLLIAGGLAVLFLLADLCLLHVEVRREAYSVTLAGVPLALGVLLLGSRELVAARLLGAGVAFALQRTTPLKTGYNLGAYALEAALGLAVMHLLVEPAPVLTVGLAIGCGTVLLLVDQVMSALVTMVIQWHAGPLSARQRAEVHLPALVCSVLATTAGYGLLLLVGQGPVGVVVLAVFGVAGALAYRAFQVLHRRHQALAHLHAFVTLSEGDDTAVDELAGRMLEQIRALMRATTAELQLPDPLTPLHLKVGEDGVPEPIGPRRRDVDPTPQAVGDPAVPTLLTRRHRDPAARAWLAAHGVNDAVVVPLPSPSAGPTGSLVVLDRLGDTGSFSREDLTLLQTLAGHLTTAVDSGRRRDRLRHEATHDGLTGLGNRALLGGAISTALAGPEGAGSAVLLLDLDRFKEVNDTLGHHVGDELLVAVAGRLLAALPASATVARLGGDEFAAFVPASARNGPAADATAMATLVAEALARPVQLREATLSTRASVGVALATTGCTASDLLRHADTAMYAAKEGPGPVVVYTADLDRGRAERLALLADLHLALDRDELSVTFQPKLDLHADRVTSVEALVRWQHPRLGPLGPDAFIPLAETNGLIGPLTKVVLKQALEQCAVWRGQGLDVAVAVNLSAKTVNDHDLPEQISLALLEAGVPASSLILEITESAVMDDPGRAVTILDRIAAIGVTLSLDDFGTGYSSLSYLQRLPVREVKIDRSFISGLTADEAHSQVLVRSIINLGISLGLRVVAEGVEDAATLELLRDLGCHLIQGYHVSRPGTAAQLDAVLRRHPDRTRLHAVTG